MKIIRWFFSHIILVLLIVVVIYGYMYWGRLVESDTPGGKAIAYLSNKFTPANESDEQDIVTGLNAGEVSQEKSAGGGAATDAKNTVENNMNASSESLVANNELQRGELSPDESLMSSQQSKASVNGTSSTIEDLAVSPDAVKINNEPFVSSGAVEQRDSFDKNSTAVDVNNTSSLTSRQNKVSANDAQSTVGDAIASANARASAVETGKDSFVSPDVEDKLNNANVNDSGETVAASQLNTKLESPEVKANWITARTSYHQRNYELSEKSYQQVIDNTEDNYDAYGELGNVYFNQGKHAQAASAYYEAAAIFVRMGQLPRAESLVGLLWRLDPSKADELQKLIDSEAS